MTFAPWRLWVFYALLVLAAVWVTWRLLELQVFQYTDYLAEAVENRVSRVNDPAPRGVIYDVRGVLLAQNLPSYNVAITPAFLPDEPNSTFNTDGTVTYIDEPRTQAIYRRLAELLEMPIVVPGSTPLQVCREGRGIKDWVDEQRGLGPFNAIKVKCDIDAQTALLIRQEIANFPMPGVEVIVEPVRQYPTGALTANIVGYLARIPAPQDAPLTYNDAISRGLLPDRDRIGVQGIESYLETTLAGQNGSRLIEEDVGGRFLQVTRVETETVAGLNVQLTIDVRLQAAVEAALLERLRVIRDFTAGGRNENFTSGAVIVMNPNTGEIYAMVTWPTYDNNRFARNLDLDYYISLVGDETANPPIPPNPDYPLLNHAVQILYPPGSVFKAVTASGALQDGVIDPERELEDPGFITIRNKYFPADPGKAKDFVCWIYRNGGRHGLVNFTRGIADSCNVYFYKIGGGFAEDKLAGLGIGESNKSGLIKWMELFGFGEPTGIEIPAEQGGFIPTPDWKRRNQGESWTTGDTYNAVIGQGFVQVTPLQMLNAYNVIINGGKLLQPQLVDKILDGEGNVIADTQPVLIRNVPLSPETIDWVRQGLRRTVVEGTLSGIRQYGQTAPVINLPGINSAGKTGSAEYCDRQAWLKDLCIPGRWPAHAWTTLYAPYENPEVSVMAFVYNGTEGSIVAGPIANDALRAYFEIIKGVRFEDVAVSPTETPTETPPVTPQ